MKCEQVSLAAINNCDELQTAFGCSECEESEGPDQPAFVVASAPARAVRSTQLHCPEQPRHTCRCPPPRAYLFPRVCCEVPQKPGFCLVNKASAAGFSCSGTFPYTRRLCACVGL